MKNEELFRLEFFILHFYTLSGVQLCIFNGIHTRSEKDQKIAQSTHENGYIKPRKTFWRNSKQLLIL